ncbi:hypothetical protein AAHA92_03186 [Salvia divinorum]|uniref:Uncharacterized protein n=1 Tax=Salvia divinorum TaxID=28513 RepID=A0ABD1IHC7_SALDI
MISSADHYLRFLIQWLLVQRRRLYVVVTSAARRHTSRRHRRRPTGPTVPSPCRARRCASAAVAASSGLFRSASLFDQQRCQGGAARVLDSSLRHRTALSSSFLPHHCSKNRWHRVTENRTVLAAVLARKELT